MTPIDDVLTQIGFDLKVFTRKSLLAEINANREDFEQSVRDLYGKDQAAAKSYVDREFDRRGIPRPEEGFWD